MCIQCKCSYIISINDFALSDLLVKPPKKADLLKLMSDIAFQWNLIGECLEIKYAYLASLQNKPSRDIDKLAEVLQCWMDTMPKPVTWNTILQTIGSPPIESKVTVMKMEEFLKCEYLYIPSNLGNCILLIFTFVLLLKNQKCVLHDET